MLFSYSPIIPLVLLVTSPADWSEIKVGDCLTVSDLQNLAQVRNIEIYQAGKCGVEYVLEGENYQRLSCGLNLSVGTWSRTTSEHKKAGFYFPRPVPCEASVTSLSNEFSDYLDIEDVDICREENLVEQVYQKEELKTKKYKAGQGYLYLPNPLQVTRYFYDEEISEVFDQCRQTSLVLSYEGWGKLNARVEVRDCLSEKVKLCLRAEMGASETDEGEMCALVDDLKSCLN